MLDSLFVANAASKMAADNEAVTSGQAASRLATEVRTQNEEIKFDVEKLFMITQALWEVLKHHHGYTDEQLEQMIQEIDLRDGRLDGKIAKSTEREKCTQCGRTMMRKRMQCMYCGQAGKHNSFKR